VAARHHAALHGLKRVEVGVRPQALRLVPPGPDRMTGRVFLREPLGLEDEVLVEAADGTRVKAVTAAGEEFPEGAVVGLDLSPRDLFLFQPDTRATLCFGTD
jgi:TOBE domain